MGRYNRMVSFNRDTKIYIDRDIDGRRYIDIEGACYNAMFPIYIDRDQSLSIYLHTNKEHMLDVSLGEKNEICEK